MDESSISEDEFVAAVIAWTRDTLGLNTDGKFADNDWTLIVKLHAIIESALNTTILAKLGLPELKRVIEKLETSNGRTGKIAFAKALQMLPPKSAAFIQKLSELRNFCVHDIANFNFSLDKYLSDLSEVDRNALLKAVRKELKEEVRGKVSPQQELMIAAMNVVTQLFGYHYHCKTVEQGEMIVRIKAERFDALNQSTPKKE